MSKWRYRSSQYSGWALVLVNAASWTFQVFKVHQNIVLGVSNFIGMYVLAFVLIKMHFTHKDEERERRRFEATVIAHAFIPAAEGPHCLCGWPKENHLS